MEGGDRRSSPPKGERGGGGKLRGSKAHGGGKERPRSGGGGRPESGNVALREGLRAGDSSSVGGSGVVSSGQGGDQDGSAVSCSGGSGANGQLARVYSKSPARRNTPSGDVFRFGEQGNSGEKGSRGGSAPMPGTVRSLLAKFRSDSGGVMAKSSWAATMEAMDAEEGSSIGVMDMAGLEVMANVSMPSTGQSSLIGPGEGGSNAVDMCCEVLKVVGNTQDSIMQEQSATIHCPSGARSNAQACLKMGSGLSNAGLPSNGGSTTPNWEGIGNQGSSGCGPGALGMPERAGQFSTVHCQQGVRRNAPATGGCRFSPTVADVAFSLDKAGFPHTSPLYETPDEMNSGGRSEPEKQPADGTRSARGDREGRQAAWKKLEPIRITQVPARSDISTDGITVDLNPGAVEHNVQKLEKALVGNLLGRKLPYHVLSGELER